MIKDAKNNSSDNEVVSGFFLTQAAKIIGRRRWIFGITLIVSMLLSGFTIFQVRDVYHATAMVAINQQSMGQFANIIGNLAPSNSRSPLNGETYTLLVNSPNFRERLYNHVSTLDTISLEASEVSQGVRAEYRAPEVIMVHGNHGSPEVAMNLSNIAAQFLLNEDREMIRSELRNSRDFLRTESEAALQEVVDLMSEKQDFVNTNGLITVELENAFYLMTELQLHHISRLSLLHAAQEQWDNLEVTMQSDTLIQRRVRFLDPMITTLEDIHREKMHDYMLLSIEGNDTTGRLDSLSNELQHIQAELQVRYQDAYQSDGYDISLLDSLLFEDYLDISRNLISMQSEVESLEEEIDHLDHRIKLLTPQTFRLEQLDIQLSLATQRYTQLEEYYQQARMEVERVRGNLTLLTNATLPRTPRWSRSLFWVFGGFASLVLAFGLCVIVDSLDDSIRTIDDIFEKSPFYLFGTINHVRSRDNKLVDPNDISSSVTKNFESVYTALEYSRKMYKFNRLLITSSITKEGKTFFAGNLALKSAQMGLRTALVELDVLHPSMADLFGIQPEKTINDVFLEKCDLKEALDFSRHENLGVLYSTVYSYNYIELFRNGRVSEMLSDLDKDFDLVILDSMPILQLSELSTILNLADAALVVARANYSKLGMLTQLSNIVEKSSARLLGLVLNDARSKTDKYYYNNEA